jgi:hypothetical protein
MRCQVLTVDDVCELWALHHSFAHWNLRLLSVLKMATDSIDSKRIVQTNRTEVLTQHQVLLTALTS